MKRGLLALTTLLLAPLAVLHAAELVLVAPGIAPAPIIVFKDAPPRTRDAAVTLADYVEKISGARPEVIDGEPKPLAACAIWMASSRSATWAARATAQPRRQRCWTNTAAEKQPKRPAKPNALLRAPSAAEGIEIQTVLTTCNHARGARTKAALRAMCPNQRRLNLFLTNSPVLPLHWTDQERS